MESMSYIKGQLVLSKQILNILPSALIFMDANGTIERINDEAIHELELGDRDIKGENISQNHIHLTEPSKYHSRAD